MGPMLVLLGCLVFLVGTVVGSFLNVCIYRIPWEKSVIWPSSRCPQCWNPIAGHDNIPIVSWIALRGECRKCGAADLGPVSAHRAARGLLFLGLFFVDVVYGPRGPFGHEISRPMATLGYHAVLFALLVAATFIDYDLIIIPDQITVTGMVLGLGIGTWLPRIRLEPACGRQPLAGTWVRLAGSGGRGGFDAGGAGRGHGGLSARGDGFWRCDA